ncbi:MAG: ribosome biogenesis GTPase Der [Eubacteriales bacterium]|nr:ribosome biogenesis GTPase Der [Eubacteriales bacterium]
MSKPVVAIVGRPNVGKSTLFNAIAGQRLAIVQDTPGVTRDRIYADVTWLDRAFLLVDTGGIEPDSQDVILSQMREQAQIAIDTADVIIFITDVKSGLQDNDARVCEMLRKSHKPIVLAVNKVDDFQKYQADVYEFYNLGIGDPMPVSAAGKQGLGDLLDVVTGHFRPLDEEGEEAEGARIAVIGKPNVGKSSIINKLSGEERLIVSDIAGTTRDAVDMSIVHEGRPYIFVDTAGIRRQKKIKDEIERYSIIRTVAAVERCDIAVLVIDATSGITSQDARIAGIAHEEGKGMIIAVNKWDAIEKTDKSVYEFRDMIRRALPFLNYADILYISAETGLRLGKLYENIDAILDNQTMRIPTGVLNEIISEATMLNQPPSDKGKRLKIFYTTQVSVAPPTFIFFVNSKELMHFSYTRYLENKLRESFGFRGTPLRFITRERKKDGR